MRRDLLQICALVTVLFSSAVAQAQLAFITNSGTITITGYTENTVDLNTSATTNS